MRFSAFATAALLYYIKTDWIVNTKIMKRFQFMK